MMVTPRDLGWALEKIVNDETHAAALTPTQARAELATLTSRIRRRRALNGVVATTGAVAAAGVIGVVAIGGINFMQSVAPEASPRPVAAAPSPSHPSSSSSMAPSPTPEAATTPVPVTPNPVAPEPSVQAADPAVAETPALSADDLETKARAVFAEYLDAWRSGDRETLRRLSDTNQAWEVPLDYTPVTPEMSCGFFSDDTYPRLDCDVDLVGSFHFIMRISIERTADGQWLARAAQMGLG